MAKFKGKDSIEFLDNQQLKGNIFEQLDGAMAFCFKHLNLSGKVIGLKREGLQLGIYDDRVEICNPGRFPTGVTPENIKTLHSSNLPDLGGWHHCPDLPTSEDRQK